MVTYQSDCREYKSCISMFGGSRNAHVELHARCIINVSYALELKGLKKL